VDDPERAVTRDGQLVAITDALYEAVVHPEKWGSFLRMISSTFDAGVAVFAHYDMDHERHRISTIVGPWDVQRYEEHFSSRNAWVNAAPQKVVSGVVVGEQLLPQRAFERSEYYNDFLRQIDIGHVMAAGIQGNTKQFTALSILRSKRVGEFAADEIRLLDHILPHLKRAVQINQRLSGVRRGDHPLATVADDLEEGLIIVNGSGRPLFVNRAANAILRRSPKTLILGRAQLRAADSNVDRRLQSLLCSARLQPSLGSPGAGGSMLVPRPAHARPLLLLVTPTCASGSWLDAATACALVWIHDPESSTGSVAGMRQTFGLSSAEERLLAMLVKGCPLREASRQLRISLHTARSQLRVIFRKTSTHSQSELMRLAAGFR
jgi:DNA-binding CsgD family transcriptional regulator